MSLMTAQAIIQNLGLEPHPKEGGCYRRTYESLDGQNLDKSTKKTASSIYYLLTRESPIGHWHRNKSEILHFFHCGHPITYWLLHQNGRIEKHTLGHEIDKGHALQMFVPGGSWKASCLEDKGEYGLISEVVIPEFRYEDMTLASVQDIQPRVSAEVWAEVQRLVKL